MVYPSVPTLTTKITFAYPQRALFSYKRAEVIAAEPENFEESTVAN